MRHNARNFIYSECFPFTAWFYAFGKSFHCDVVLCGVVSVHFKHEKEMCFKTFGIFFSFRLQVKSIETKINSFMETINTLSEITNGSHVVAKTKR